MAWWPRQTPRSGISPASSLMACAGDAGVLGSPGPRRDEQAVGGAAPDLGDVDGVVAEDLELGAELAELLDEVVGERVVVVDDQDAGRHGN